MLQAQFFFGSRMFVALVIQHAMRMCRIAVCAFFALHDCSTLTHKRRNFMKIWTVQCVLGFSLQTCLKHFTF